MNSGSSSRSGGLIRFATSFFGSLPDGVGKAATKAYFKSHAFCKLGRHGVHSDQKIVVQDKMRVRILPALSDNYMYLIVDEKTGDAAIVDPVAPETVAEAVRNDTRVNLTTILTTHHHWDHSGGNAEMKKMMPQLAVYGGDDRIDAMTNKVEHGTKISLGSLIIECLFTPCHTTGHICYFVTQPESAEPPAVFTGDTLFLGGCGKFFEGTAEQMQEALNVKLASLPDETLVYCGHEYAIQNLNFGLSVEPNNAQIRAKLNEVEAFRSQTPPVPSVPSTIGTEKMVNPFMRVDTSTVIAAAGGTTSGVETMRAIRALKDNFKPPK